MKKGIIYISMILLGIVGIFGAGTITFDTGDQFSVSNNLPIFNSVNMCLVDGSTTFSKINNILYVDPNNATDIQNQINNCIGKCSIIVPSGQYNITTPINLVSNLELIGIGKPIIYRNSNIVMMNTTESLLQNVTIKGLVFESEPSISEINGIHLRQTSGNNINIIENEFYYFNESAPISLANLDLGQSINDSKILNNHLQYVEKGIVLNGYNLIVSNNYLEDNFFNTSDASEYGEGIECNNGAQNVVDSNVVLGFKEDGIDMNCKRSIVSNNYVRMSDDTRFSTGINSGRADYITITGNVVENVGSNDIGINGGGSSQIETGFTISSNVVFGNSVGQGIVVESEDSHISSNTISNTAVGINVTSSDDSSVKTGQNVFSGVSTEYSFNTTDVVSSDYWISDESLYIPNKLGIGDNTPSYELEISSPATADASIVVDSNNAGDSGISFSVFNGVTDYTMGIDNNRDDRFLIGYGARTVSGITALITLDKTTGRVGIKTGDSVAPVKDLEVNGALQSDDYYSGDGTQGATTTCGAATTITVKDGLITACS